jgi:hypothetical protein
VLRSVGARAPLVRLISVLALLALVSAPAGWAGGDPNPHDEVSSVSQYIEDIPTAEGPVVAGGGSEPPPPPAPLQPVAGEALARAGGRDEPALKEIATNPSLGAPTRALPKSSAVNEALDEPSAASAVASASTGGGTALIVALVLLALVTLGSAAVAVRRARPGPRR